MLRLIFLCFVLGFAGTANAEAQMAGFAPLPESSPSSFCRKAPCSPGCSQNVTCDDYDPRRDICANKSQVLVGWRCSGSCSCADDGTVVCSVAYRCVDMAGEMAELRRVPRPEIYLSQPNLPGASETPESRSSAEESDSGEPIK